MQILGYFIGGMLMQAFCIYAWSKFVNKTINFADFKFYVIVFLLTLCGTAFTFLMPPFLKMIFITFSMMVICYFYVNKNIKKSIISVLITQSIIMVLEMIFVFIVNTIPKFSIEKLMQIPLGTFLLNFVITAVCFLLAKFNLLNRIFHSIINALDKVKNRKVVKYMIVIIVLTVTVTTISYLDLPYKYVLLINTLILLLALSLFLDMTNLESKYEEIFDKYNISLNSLDENFEILDKYKRANHENKNELEEIRGLALLGKNHEICDYIDEILNTRIKYNEKLLKSTYRVPDVRLRALLYSKMNLMEERDIKLHLKIAKNIKSKSFSSISNRMMIALCKLFSIYIDNAIEYVCTIDKKVIDIDIYLEDKFLKISVSNPYDGKLDLEKIDRVGYSSKGKDRGYGLPLAADIFSEFPKLTNEREISKTIFSQVIVIEL